MDLLLFAAVSYKLLYDVPVHERFAAEEVDIKVLVES